MAGLSGNIDHLNPIEVEVEVGLGLSLAIELRTSTILGFYAARK